MSTSSSSSKLKINIQDQFLNQARRDKIKISIELISGSILTGLIKSFDNFCVLIETDKIVLVYKHAISNLYPANKGTKMNLFQNILGSQSESNSSKN